MKKNYFLPLVYFFLSCIIFILSIVANQGYFYSLSNENIIWYQLRQAGSVLVLYGIGYALLKMVQYRIPDRWVLLLSFPCGIAAWVFASFALLLTDIVYYQYRVYLLILIALIMLYAIRKKRKLPACGKWLPDKGSLFIIIGTALLVSTGWNYVIMNYDSYLYFANYGKTLTLFQEWKAFNTGNAYVLTNIGQFLPLVNSYAAFWGYDFCLPIQTFLILNTVCIFGVSIFEYAKDKLKENSAKMVTLICVLLMISCTPLLIYSNWLLSNAFLMVYLFVVVVVADKIGEDLSFDYGFLIIGASLAITLLRKDGIIIVCFLFICFSCRKLSSPGKLLLLFLPSALIQLYYVYYIKKVIGAITRTATGTSILNNKFIALTLLAIIGTILFILGIRNILDKVVKGKIYIVLLLGMLAVALGAIILKPATSIDHIDAILRVAMGDSYGYSVFVWGMLICIIFLTNPKFDYHAFMILGYCVLTFLIYWNKGNTEQGIDNSGMRMFYQMIPVFYYYFGRKWIELQGVMNGKISERYRTDL